MPFYRKITVIEQLEIIAGNNFDAFGVNLTIRYFGINANHEKLLSGNNDSISDFHHKWYDGIVIAAN